MKRYCIGLAAAALALWAPVGLAGDYGEGYDRGSDDSAWYVDAPVVDVRPRVRVVEVSRPRRVCHEAEVVREVRPDRRGPAAGTVVGTIIGGAIGHNAAGRHGRGAATVAGAVLGATIGREISRAHRGPPREVVTTERRCEVERSVHEEERIDGYRVFYRYAGRTFQTRTEHEPGDTIRVRVRLTPVH